MTTKDTSLKKRVWYILVVLFLFLALPHITRAQGPPDPDDVPIDGGLGLLLAAGAAYGVKKYRGAKKQSGSEAQFK